MNNVYRVWFESTYSQDVCCVLVAAPTEKRALELAQEQTKDFPDLQDSRPRIALFDTSAEKASIC